MKTNRLINRRSLIGSAAALVLAATSSAFAWQTADFTGTIPGPNGLQLKTRVYRPAAPGSYPAVIVMHGSGGMWSNNVVDGNLVSHLDTWVGWLRNNGFVAVAVDSYTNRITTPDFKDRRPADDHAVNDAYCSPAYVRPNDAYAARAWLVANAATHKVNTARIGLLAFSQGAEAALSAVVDESILANKPADPDAVAAGINGKLAKWVQRWLKWDNTEIWVGKPLPQFHAPGSDHFNVVVAYYPGCGFYNYWGKLTSAAANCYMPHCPTLVMHGSADNLWGSTVQNFVEKSRLQAVNLGRPNDATTADLQTWVNSTFSAAGLTMIGNAVNPMTHVLLPSAHHSFDLMPNLSGGTADDTTAKANARTIAQTWLMTYLAQ